MNASLPAGFARWSSWPSGADAASAFSHCLDERPHRGDKQETSGALIFHSITRCPNHARTPGKQGKLHRITAVPPDLPRVPWAAAGLPYRHALGRWGVYEKLGRLERANVLKVAALAMRPLIRAGFQPLKTSTRPLETAASRVLVRNFELMPIEIENITMLARENDDVAIDLRRMLNHQPPSARFVDQTDEALKSLGIPVLAPLLVARTPDRAGHPY